jgi:type I restriction enzyme R subunit
LYEYVQIFVISNGTNTKYYSNSTRYNAIKDAKHSKTKKEKTSNSFEFTSYWADANNRVLTDLIDFTRTFFAKHTILSVLTRYCIFTSEKMLMVMRPYQITATERILNRIEIANNYKKYGSIGRWLHLAHHWLRQDADLFQNGTVGIAAALHRQGAVCGRPQGLGLPDHEGI